MTQKVTIIIGLPGSGKTTYIKDHQKDFEDALICDDYHKSAGNSSDNFLESGVNFRNLGHSIYFRDLKKSVSEGKNIVISDIVYCKKDRLEDIENEVRRLADELEIKVVIDRIFFENDPEACINNILRRSRDGRVERELKFVREVSKKYDIPEEAEVIEVYKG